MFPTGCRTTGKLSTKPRWAGSAYHVQRPQVLGSCQSFSCLVIGDCLLNFLGSYKTVGSQASGDYGSGENRNCFGGAHSLPAPNNMGYKVSEEKEPWTSAGNVPTTLTITENLEWNWPCNPRQSFKALVRLGRPQVTTATKCHSEKVKFRARGADTDVFLLPTVKRPGGSKPPSPGLLWAPAG